MESFSNKKKLIESKPLNIWERAYLPAIVHGLSITMKHFFRKFPRFALA
jgi:NADH-quinone oxidoreductase subunit I